MLAKLVEGLSLKDLLFYYKTYEDEEESGNHPLNSPIREYLVSNGFLDNVLMVHAFSDSIRRELCKRLVPVYELSIYTDLIT